MKPLVVLACQVLEPLLAHRVDAASQEYLGYGLHVRPVEMRPALQSRLDSLAEPSTVIIGYGLCGNGLVGLESGRHTLVLPRTHDCIGMMLGSMAQYAEAFAADPATYYLTKGWLESGDEPLSEYRGYVDEYGRERADRLIDMMYGSYRKLRLLAFSDVEMESLRPTAAPVVEFCRDRWDMAYDERIGDTGLIERLGMADTTLRDDPDLLVLPPGTTVTQQMYLDEPAVGSSDRAHM